MVMNRSSNLGGLADNRVRAAMFYNKKRRLKRQRDGNLITGTAPIIAPLTNGTLLTTSVTWTVPNQATIGSVKQMRLNSTSWVSFSAGQTVTTGQTWTVREYTSDAAGNMKLFNSNSREVTA